MYIGLYYLCPYRSTLHSQPHPAGADQNSPRGLKLPRYPWAPNDLDEPRSIQHTSTHSERRKGMGTRKPGHPDGIHSRAPMRNKRSEERYSKTTGKCPTQGNHPDDHLRRHNLSCCPDHPCLPPTSQSWDPQQGHRHHQWNPGRKTWWSCGINISLHRGQIKKDGIHLTNESAEAIAENISTAIQSQRNNETRRENIRVTVDSENIELQNTDDNPTTEEFETTRQIAAKIIGKGGDRIRIIKSLYNVEIHTVETGENARNFSISGMAEDTTKVLKVMKCIANETEDHDLEQQTRAQFTNAPRPPTVTKIPTRCWYYAKGECYRGRGCKFLHEQGPTDSERSASTTESEEREPTPVRKVTIKRKPLPQTTPDDEDTHHKQPAKTKTHMHSKPRRHRTPSVSPERTERQGTKRNSRPRKGTSISPEGYELWHPHNWPVTTTNHLPPQVANFPGHQRVSVFV